MHETFFALLQLEQVERHDEIAEKAARLESAVLTNYAVNAPQHLDAARKDFRRSLERKAAPAPRGPLTAAERDFTARTIARLQAQREAERAGGSD